MCVPNIFNVDEVYQMMRDRKLNNKIFVKQPSHVFRPVEFKYSNSIRLNESSGLFDWRPKIRLQTLRNEMLFIHFFSISFIFKF